MTVDSRPTASSDSGNPYQPTEGPVLLSGIQALVRLTIDQRRLDTRRGLNTSVFVSGYQGSPLGGVDLEFERNSVLVSSSGIVVRPGLNEELAATAVAGTQLLDRLPGKRYSGVTGFWYGKNPGLDRAADAIRHGNLQGTARFGGAVAWIGDDPACKSSSIPSACESMARSLMIPLLAPSSVSEIVELGLHAVELSRFAGVWVGLKIVADMADASATVDVSGMGDDIPQIDRDLPDRPHPIVGPEMTRLEDDLVSTRLARAREYMRIANLNHIVSDGPRSRLGIVSCGHSYSLMLRALERLGLDEGTRSGMGVRIIKLAVPWPIDSGEIRRLTAGLEEVLVVEDKAEFLEDALRSALYGQDHQPLVSGKRDPEGSPLLPAHGALDADRIATAIANRLHLPSDIPHGVPEGGRRQLTTNGAPASRVTFRPRAQLAERTPYFCSGCPHNISTRAGDAQLVGVGIGCHTMVALDESGRGNLVGITQMGGEGAQWIGMAPFTEDNHFVQNIGDGTFFHSGSLAVRAAVAAGVNLTYKLLYNSAVAMTGGQDPEGRIGIPALTGWLALEGVTRVVITTPELSNYRGVALDPIAEVRHRDELAAVEAELARVEGVTVLIHDDRCAAEERRLRKRGELATPSERVWINQRVCEGCGDCASVSSCLSVVPVDTEFGRKTAIHQSSCNQDLSCLKGNCPSFVVVTPGRRSRGSTSVADPPITPPPPRFRRPDADHLIRMPGIGGAGVVTASKVLQQAARLDGWSVAALDQTGLAQKGGPVISDVRLSRAPIQGSVGATKESVDVLIAFDTVTAGGMSALATTRSAHTVVVVDTAQVPTASMVRDPASIYPGDDLLTVIDASTSMEDNIRIPARWIAERLFADHIPANMVLLGAAYQHGCLPIEGDAIEAAIRLSSSNAEVNLKAFHWGRAAVADLHATVGALTSTPAAPTIDPAVSDLVAPRDVPSEMVASLRRCVQELSDYQDIRVARGYLDHVMHVTEIERDRLGHGQSRIATAYALQLFKLTAYKDEYEVARLHLDPIEQSRLESEFGTGARTRVMLHPPLLRSLGLRHKISLGRATRPAFKILYAARFMRGSSFDLFGRSPVRRIERSLPAEYRSHVGYALEHLKPETVDLVLAIVNAPDVIRGYEEIKLRNVARYRAMVDELLNELDGMVGAPTSH